MEDGQIELAEQWWDWLVHPITGWMTPNKGAARHRAVQAMQKQGVDYQRFMDNLTDETDD